MAAGPRVAQPPQSRPAPGRRAGRHRAPSGSRWSRAVLPAVVLVAAAGVVAAVALGDGLILRVALASVAAVVVLLAVLLAVHGYRRAGRLRAALGEESAARRAEVAALHRQASALTAAVEAADAGRASLAGEVQALRAVVARIEVALLMAQAQAAAVSAAAADTARSAARSEDRPDDRPGARPAVAAARDTSATADLAAVGDDDASDDQQIVLWPDMSEAPTVVDLLAWEEQAVLRRVSVEPGRRPA